MRSVQLLRLRRPNVKEDFLLSWVDLSNKVFARSNSLQVLLNDLDISTLHLERLIEDIQQGTFIHDSFLDSEVEQVIAQIKSLLSTSASFRSTIKAWPLSSCLNVDLLSSYQTSIEQLIAQLVRPRLRTLHTDLFRDVTYVLDEDAFSAADYSDIVRKRFVKVWEGLVDGFIVRFHFLDSNARAVCLHHRMHRMSLQMRTISYL